MQAHERITALSASVAAAAQRYRLLLEVNNAVITNLTREGLFGAIAGALRRLVPYARIALFLHDPARDALRLTVLESTLATEHFVVGWEQTSRDSPAGWAFQRRQPLVRRDLAQERPYKADELSYADGVRCYVIIPLLVRDEAIGVLTVASTAPDRYGEAEVQLLQEVGTQVALAVVNMRAFEEIAALKARLQRESVYLQEEIRREHNFIEMVGTSPALGAALRKVEQVASLDSTVLIAGETGTGKELIARAIHDRSRRRAQALVKVNCSALSAGLVESELFGHVKGAFTGALERRTGRFELADGGTIFLDEVGELPLETQVKLLRVLQEQEFEPVGSSQTVRVDVRIIAATNRDLEEAVRAGRFRADLFFRLNVFPIVVPPLRERATDIRQLTMFFLERFTRRFGKAVDTVSRETMERLVSYPWPGNVRELQNCIERAVILAEEEALHPRHLNLMFRESPDQAADQDPWAHVDLSGSLADVTRRTVAAVEARKLKDALREAGDNKGRASEILGITYKAFLHKLKEYGIE
jgi:formate hydrogenlyase transcriptional activator